MYDQALKMILLHTDAAWQLFHHARGTRIWKQICYLWRLFFALSKAIVYWLV